MRIRLSKTALLVLGIGIFAIAFGSLYMLYSRQRQEQEQLNDTLAVVQATLPNIASEKTNWEKQLTEREGELTQLESDLTQATSLLDSAKTDFPESVESIEYDERLFNIADGWDLEVTILTTAKPTNTIAFGITSGK